MDAGTPFSADKYVDVMLRLQEEFDHRFADFKTHRATFHIFVDPSPLMCKMPLLCFKWSSLSCSATLNSKFREVSGKADKLGQPLRELSPSFPRLSRMFKRTMCLFGSTYLCEKLFSTLNFNKSKYRSRLTDDHLQDILRVATASSLRPNVARLCERKRCQVSSSKEEAREAMFRRTVHFLQCSLHVQKKVIQLLIQTFQSKYSRYRRLKKTHKFND